MFIKKRTYEEEKECWLEEKECLKEEIHQKDLRIKELEVMLSYNNTSEQPEPEPEVEHNNKSTKKVVNGAYKMVYPFKSNIFTLFAWGNGDDRSEGISVFKQFISSRSEYKNIYENFDVSRLVVRSITRKEMVKVINDKSIIHDYDISFHFSNAKFGKESQYVAKDFQKMYPERELYRRNK